MSDTALGWLVISTFITLPLAYAGIVSALRTRGIWSAGKDKNESSGRDSAGCGGGGCGAGCGGGCGGG